jgi:hypothetical protein
MESKKSNPAASAIREFFLLSSQVGKYCGGASVDMMAPPLALGRNIPSSRARAIGQQPFASELQPSEISASTLPNSN